LKGIRAVLFDAGGTLIHVDGERISRAAGVAYEEAVFRKAESDAVARVRAFVLERPDSSDAERVPLYFHTLLAGLGFEAEDVRTRAAGAIVAEHSRANLWSKRAERALETLETLGTRGYRMAVISNADGRVRGLLEEAGLTPHLEFVVDSGELGIEKPDSRIFHAATERLGLPPAECVYVGDIYEIDVVGAERAGLAPILIGDGPAPPGVRRVATLEALLTLLPGLA
jgi:HAD superfamily hydrolase (TIGR01509 family)